MDATSIIADWKQRLIAMAENPPYVFRNTPQELIDEYHSRMTTFIGYSEAEVSEAETSLGVRFPLVFRTYLREMGISSGDLFRGSDLAGISELEKYRADAQELLAETDPVLDVPRAAVVFLFHQGYMFMYILGTGGFDGPVMQWMETEHEPKPIAETFAQMVDDRLRLMEDTDSGFREQGGYYVTLDPEGGMTQTFPAISS